MTRGALEDKFVFNEFKKLITEFDIKKIVETGTYYGWSSIILSKFNIPIKTIEFSEKNFKEAKNNLEKNNIQNVEIILGSSSDVLENILVDEEKNLFLFLDAHWYDYWPIHDELNVCIKKKIKPVIAIHDFFVPDENGRPKFGFDKYKNQKLDFEYIEQHLIQIYGENNFNYHYNDSIDTVDSGLIYIYPKK
jgi:predicted O-methyltransferase YrrM